MTAPLPDPYRRPPNRVREFRLARGMSQQKLANIAEIALRTLVYVEAGKDCRPPVKRAILSALGMNYSDLDERREVFPE